MAELPVKSLLASLLPLKVPSWKVRKNQPLYDFIKMILGFFLGAVGVLWWEEIFLFFHINGIFMFSVQLLPVLRTLDHRIN